jgi:hypothetical protein
MCDKMWGFGAQLGEDCSHGLWRRQVSHNLKLESLAKSVLQMLGCAQTPQLSIDHDSDPCAKGFGFLH